MEKKRIFHRTFQTYASLLLLATLIGCSSNGTIDTSIDANDASKDNPSAAPSESQTFGIYSGTFEQQSATFICSGTDCLITVNGKTYARAKFTNLTADARAARAAGFTANITIVERVNADGELCPISGSETMAMVFPAEGSTDPIKLIKDGVTTELTRQNVFTVTFDHGNNDYSSIPVKAGDTLNTHDPIYNSIAKGNYTLMDWCLDKGCTQSAPNPMTVDKNITLYAKWTMTSSAAPTVTLVSDGISFANGTIPKGAQAMMLKRITADGSWHDVYYRNGGLSSSILYPFVSAGKEYRFAIAFFDAKGYTCAISPQFTVTPTGGVGEFTITNKDSLTINISGDQASISEKPVITGSGKDAIENYAYDFEFFKGNGFSSETWNWLSAKTVSGSDTTKPLSIMRQVLGNGTVSCPSGRKYFIHYVARVLYKSDFGYRVFDRASPVQTLTYSPGWNILSPTESSITYTPTIAGTKATVKIDSNPDSGYVQLVYAYDQTITGSNLFKVTVTNTADKSADLSLSMADSSFTGYTTLTSVAAGNTGTLEMPKKITVLNPVFFVTAKVDSGTLTIENTTSLTN